jgi:spore maturation protein CgeB
MGAPYPNRVELFSKLGGFSLGLWGKGWSDHEATLPGMVREGSRLVSPEEESKIYRASKILINLHSSAGDDSSQLNDFLNPRTFTAALCGVFQLIDERTLLPQAFDIGPEVVTFSGTEDLCEKLTYFLSHADEREACVRAARARALREHTYEIRFSQALSMMGLSD